MLVSLHECKFINVKSFLRYVLCKIKEETKQKLYKSYVTNCLKGIASNTAKFGGGITMKKTYAESIKKIEDINIFARKTETKQNITAEQIIVDIIAHGGLKLSHRKGG